MKRSRIVLLSLIVLVIVLALPAFARADGGTNGCTWDESAATQPAPDGWTWDEEVAAPVAG